MPLLECSRLAKDFPIPGGRHRVFGDVSFTLEAGRVALLLGPSGAGKSTLLALLGGLERPSSGSIALDGIAYGGLRPRELTSMRRNRIGIVFQSFLLIESLTAAENVEVALVRRGLRRPERMERANALLHELGVEAPTLLPRALSEGLRQRVAIARALARDPALVLADEPTAQLDSDSAARTASLLLDAVAKRGATLLVATHGATGATLFERSASRVLELRDGRIRDA